MSFTTLGKKDYLVLRDSSLTKGSYVDGEYVDAVKEEHTIRANIQPSLAAYRTQLLPEGDRDKDAIAIFSNDWLHTARSGSPDSKNGDLISYRNTLWEVVISRPYGNFGEHCEALAVRRDKELPEYLTGDIENIT